MADKAFPEIAQKLNAPVRKTAFERQKEEAEAKRKREEAETAAALRDFEESFADNGGEQNAGGQGYQGYGGRGGGLGFRGSMRGGMSRPYGGGGMRGSGPGSLPPPPVLGRKRGYDGSFAAPQQKDRGMFSYSDGTQVDSRQVVHTGSDSEEDPEEKEKAAPRQMMQLSDLPMGTTQDEILSLLQKQAPKLKVDKVDILPPPAPGSTTKKSLSAIVTMADSAVSREVDSAMTALQRLYLGLGHRLTISRHLSSSISAATGAQNPSNDSLPFGAKVLELGNQHVKPRYNMAAPPSEPGYGSGGFNSQANLNLPSTVYVKVPSDLRQLKLINKTIEGLIKIGPEFEAALMQRPEVRSEEKWSWLFDSTSTGGVYFRWRLWYLTSGRFAEREEERNEAGTHAPEVIFRDEAPWQAPDRRPRFERVTHVEEFLSDPEYDEDEEEYSDNEESKKAPELNLTGEASEAQYLNPLHRARLTHLLSRLPDSPANLRRGDIARVSAFAYRHAGHGAEEVAQMLVSNVSQPLSLTDANPFNHPPEGIEYLEDNSSAEDNDGSSDYEPPMDVVPTTEDIDNKTNPSNAGVPIDTKMDDGQGDQEKEDTSSAKLIGLYVISDMLHGCDTAGVRNAWKYKGLVEKAFRDQKIFEHLGRMERDMSWGKVKGDRWRSRVMNLLDIWTGWNLYAADTMQSFIDTFKNPPLTEEEKVADEKERKEREARRKAQKVKAPVVRQSSEPAQIEEPVEVTAVKGPLAAEANAPKEDNMDVDYAADKPAEDDAKMGDTDADAEGDDGNIFGVDGAGEQRPKLDKEKLSSVAADVRKFIASKGSQRPSTRAMLDD
jgi:U2-associated protein SR140